MALHILDLTRFNKGLPELTTSLDRWLYFLRHAAALDADRIPEPLNVPEVRWALGDLMTIAQSDYQRDRYESHIKMQRDVFTALAEKLDQGRAEGRTEQRWSEIQFLHETLGHGVVALDELRTLSASDLDNLESRLRAELKAKLANGS